ncbi:DoxX family protein [Achromobacter sp.]|uniref:DoxX family protein n=1 Tax=Achromobacter sp. TaxID=134375 RepID=UPI003C709860
MTTSSTDAYNSTPAWVAKALAWPVTAGLGRTLLTLPFWYSGIGKLLDFQAATEEAAGFGLSPAPLVAAATIAVQLLGSALIILRRRPWLGAGALIVFVLMAIPVAHPFWQVEGAQRHYQLMWVAEHMGLIGGLMLAASMGEKSRSAGRQAG